MTNRSSALFVFRGSSVLISEPLINVMLSRARGLLVIVGDFAHFARYGQDTKWRDVCTAVRRFGRVIPAGRVYEA